MITGGQGFLVERFKLDNRLLVERFKLDNRLLVERFKLDNRRPGAPCGAVQA